VGDTARGEIRWFDNWCERFGVDRVAETMRSRAGRSAFIRTMCSAS